MTFLPVIPWALLVLGAALAHLRLVSPLSGFLVSVLAAPTGVLIVLLIIVLRIRGVETAHPWVMCGVALAPCILLAATGRDVVRYPRINDVTTDLADPPAFVAIAALPENRDRNLAFPDSFADEIRRAYPAVHTQEWKGNDAFADRIYEDAAETANAQPGWTVVRADPSVRMIEAIAETGVFRFRDYIVVRIARHDNAVVLDMRSKSRDGQSDLGVNAKRIQTFLDAIKAHVEE